MNRSVGILILLLVASVPMGGAVALAQSPSPDRTEVPRTASQLVDNNLSVWTIASDGRILRNGTQAGNGQGSIILWSSGSINVFGTDGNWWRWTGNGWTNVGSTRPGGTTTPGGTTPPPPPPTSTSPSPSGTEVPTNATQVRDTALVVWTIGSDRRILRNGAQAGNGAGSIILWYNSAIYVLGTDANWWRWTGTGWTNVGSTKPGGTALPPPPNPTPVPSPGGDSLTLMWDASASSNVIGYRVRVGTTSGNYTSTYDVGNATSYVVSSLTAGQRYYFSVNAYAPGPVNGASAPEVSGFSNAAPALTNPGNQSSLVGTAASLQLSASDPGGSPVSYSATGLPPGLSIVSSTGRISGTPTAAGSYSVTARASDGTLTDSETFTWSVTTSNGAPVLTNPGNRTSMVGTAATLQLTAVDPNGSALSFTATGLPPGLAISSTGRITGTPTTTGNYGVSARVSDGTMSDTEAFTWTVTASNAAPVLTNPGSQTSVRGTSVSLQLIANDPNGSPLNFLATGLPAGLTISSTGRVTGTSSTAGTFAVTATVSDGLLVDVEMFTWTVTSAPVNDTRPPTVTITVPTTSWSTETTQSFITIGGTATDDVDVVEVTWVNDRGGSGSATGTYSWIATIPLASGGAPWNLITVTVRDRAGKVSTDTIHVRKR